MRVIRMWCTVVILLLLLLHQYATCDFPTVREMIEIIITQINETERMYINIATKPHSRTLQLKRARK